MLVDSLPVFLCAWSNFDQLLPRLRSLKSTLREGPSAPIKLPLQVLSSSRSPLRTPAIISHFVRGPGPGSQDSGI